MNTKTLPKLLTAAAIAAGTLAAPQVAQAKKPGVLEGKPIVVDRLELRKMRFSVTPMIGMSLSQPFVHVGTAGAKLRFDFLDWLGVRAGFQYGAVPVDAKLLKGINGGALPVGVNDAGQDANETGNYDSGTPNRKTEDLDNPAPLLHDFRAGLTRLQWMASADLAFTPFSGKLGLFSSVFTEYDLYVFGGLGITSWQRHYPDAQSTSQQKGITNDDDPNGAMYCNELSGADNTDCALHPVKSQEGIKLGGSVGGGIHLFITDWVSINPEIHDIIVRHNPAGLNATVSDVPPVVDKKDNVITHNLMFNLGVTFYFPPKAKRSRLDATSATDAAITGPGPDAGGGAEAGGEAGGEVPTVGGEVGAPPPEEGGEVVEDDVISDEGVIED